MTARYSFFSFLSSTEVSFDSLYAPYFMYNESVLYVHVCTLNMYICDYAFIFFQKFPNPYPSICRSHDQAKPRYLPCLMPEINGQLLVDFGTRNSCFYS